MGKKLPFWLFYPRRYPYRNADESPKHPLKLLKGTVINHVEVLQVHRERSHFYDQTQPAGKTNRFEHLTGDVDCKCLICGREFTTRYKTLCVNNPQRSIWSCGCERRPFGTGHRKRKTTGFGRQPKDITDQVFGSLEPMQWVPDQGWLCLCHQCGNTDGCLVPESRLLTRGTVTACRACAPWQWRTGRRSLVTSGEPQAPAEARPVPVPVPVPVSEAHSSILNLPEEGVKVVVDWDEALTRMREWEKRAKVRGQSLTGE